MHIMWTKRKFIGIVLLINHLSKNNEKPFFYYVEKKTRDQGCKRDDPQQNFSSLSPHELFLKITYCAWVVLFYIPFMYNITTQKGDEKKMGGDRMGIKKIPVVSIPISFRLLWGEQISPNCQGTIRRHKLIRKIIKILKK